MDGYYQIEPCASSNAYDIVFRAKINLNKAELALSAKTMAKTPVVMILKFDNVDLSIYASGRMMLKNCSRKKSEELAKNIFEKFKKGEVFVED